MKARNYLIAIAAGAGVGVLFWFGAMALFGNSSDAISNAWAPYIWGLFAVVGGLGLTIFTGLMLFARDRMKSEDDQSTDGRELS